MIYVLVFAAAVLCSAVATGLVRRYALSSGLLDHPNARSSHSQPTPRGGGLAIVLTVLAGTVYLTFGVIDSSIGLAMITGGLVVAVVGYLDDRRGLSARSRVIVHLVATGLSLWILDADLLHRSMLPFVHESIMILVVALAIVWSINLFNFMDGIDGLAASQAAFFAGASGVLVLFQGERGFSFLLLLSAGSCIGFLLWNRPPAKIFLGDVGSGFLGFWLAALALALHLEGSLKIWTSIILMSLFISDATTTLLVRVAKGQRWYEAHRSHAYQRLSRRWNSHAKVSGLLWMLNLAAVLPIAILSLVFPSAAPMVALGTLASFGALAWRCGAGNEQRIIVDDN